ncbi:hypothetical protein [Nocardioides ferulae]|uniref:hypothetical protein n=1 Tax=Nocardioides ferulae TaxID=2340821 RepID=UPI000F893EC1|nr:hypothetical protein [Nocardioides ferulae]
MARTALVAWLTLLLALTLAFGAGLAPATADSTITVDFDDLPPATPVGTQYVAQGVTFVETAGALGATGLPATLADSALAHSDANVVESTCFACEFVPHSIRADLSTTAKAVSAHVASGCTAATVSLRGYSADGATVATASAPVGRTAMVPLTVDDPEGSDIAFVRFFDDQPGCTIRVDTLSVTHPDVGPPADVALSTTASVVTIAAGAPQSVPITVSRINGSTGGLTMSATGQGAGVGATFTPNPVTGTGTSTTLLMEAAYSAPFDEDGSTVVTVTGTPAGSGVAPGPRSTSFRLRVVPTLVASAPAAITAAVCSSARQSVYIDRAPGFTGPVTVVAAGAPAGVQVSFDPPVDPDAGGTDPSPHTMEISPGPTATPGTSTLSVAGSNPSATWRADDTVLTVTPLQLTGVPSSAAPGERITLRSSGFCPGSTFRFGNDLASVTPPADAYNADRTQVQVTVPRLATTGPVRVLASGTEVGASSRVRIREFRRQTGFSFENWSPNHPMNHAILERTYGRAETNLSIDLCWPFGCSIVTDWIDPLAWVFMKISNEVLTKGECFGIAMTGQRLARGLEPMSRYQPAGASTPWELTGPSGPAPALRDTIAGWHSVQLSTQFIQKWVREFVANATMPTETLRSRFSAISPANPALVSIKEGTKGHAFIAYGFRALPGGGWEVDINDPNIPYTLAEETDTSGVPHRDRLALSTLTFDASGNWVYPGFNPDWDGGKEAIALVPMSEWPRDPSMPTGVRDLLSLIVPFGEAPDGVVTDASGRSLAADGTGDLPGTTMPILSGEDDDQVAFAVEGTGPLTYAVPNPTGRSYGQGLVGPGLAARIDGIDGTAGGTDLIGSDASAGRVWLDAAGDAGDLEVQVARQERGRDGGQRLVDLRLGEVADEQLSVTVPDGAGAVVVENEGDTATVRGTVGWAGPGGLPGTVRLPGTSLEPGQSLLVRPRDWHSLTGRPTVVQVRDAGGDVVSQTTVTAAVPDLVQRHAARLRGVRGTQRRLVVSARTSRLPAGSQLVQTVQVLRGKRVVRTVQRDRDFRGGKARWTAKLALPDGRYRLRLVTSAVIVRGAVPTTDSATRTVRVRLR